MEFVGRIGILPVPVAAACARASIRFLEFFASIIRNPHTCQAYARAVSDFLAWCQEHGVASIAAVPASPVLAPGFGHQGAQYADLDRLYGPAAPVTIVSASRSILEAGPDGIVDAIQTQAAEVLACRG